MHRTFIALAALALVLACRMVLADEEHGKGPPARKVLSQKDVAETLDGKKARATTVEVTLGPGQASAPHRHPGPVFGYVIEGEYEWAIDDNPIRTLKAGDTFYEPTGCLHRVSKNPGDKNKTRVLAVVLHPRDVEETAVPEKEKK
jgi:quercetin dioxygenase-like cupin family protein